MLARIEHQGDTTMSDGRESVETREPDVGAILEQLRAEVRARRLTEGRAELSSVERELQRALDEIELHRVVSAHWPLYGKMPLQKAIALVNKLVRRYLRWYVNPIVEQQNAGNAAFTVALSHLIALDSARRAEVARIRAGRGQGTGDREQGTR